MLKKTLNCLLLVFQKIVFDWKNAVKYEEERDKKPKSLKKLKESIFFKYKFNWHTAAAAWGPLKSVMFIDKFSILADWIDNANNGVA